MHRSDVIRRADAERFIEEVRGDEPEMAAKLRTEERELEAGGLNSADERDRLAATDRRGLAAATAKFAPWQSTSSA